MKLFFDDVNFDGQLQRAVGKCDAGMANVGECLYIASQITPGDRDSWYAVWSQFADGLVQQADDALAAGHTVSAAGCFLRAAEYYRQAFFPDAMLSYSAAWRPANSCAARSIACARCSGDCAPCTASTPPMMKHGHAVDAGLLGGVGRRSTLLDILRARQEFAHPFGIEAAIGRRLHQHLAVGEIAAIGEIKVHQPLLHLRRLADVARPQDQPVTIERVGLALDLVPRIDQPFARGLLGHPLWHWCCSARPSRTW